MCNTESKAVAPEDHEALPAAASPSRTTPPATMPPSGTPRWVWILLFLLTATIVGGTAGLLSHAAGNSIPAAILTGGGAFAGTVVLLLAIAHYIGGK